MSYDSLEQPSPLKPVPSCASGDATAISLTREQLLEQQRNDYIDEVKTLRAELEAVEEQVHGYEHAQAVDKVTIHDLHLQLAAMTQERDALQMHHDATGLALGLSGLEGRSHASYIQQLTQQLADSQTANAALREELEQLRADYRSEQRMSEDFEQQLAASEARVKQLEAWFPFVVPSGVAPEAGLVESLRHPKKETP